MSRRRKGDPVHGVVLLDKPYGISSNQALQRVRQLFNARKAGHTGTLDPFATGMLPLCLGEATKTSAFLLDAHKAYRATAVLGIQTDTGDLQGKVVQTLPVPGIDEQSVLDVLAGFAGEIEQIPPMYSALKRDGKPLYELARQGIEVKREPRSVTIHQLRLVAWQSPNLTFEVVCSKGTYVRTLGENIASQLGCCAHLSQLRRRWVAPFEGSDMVSLDDLESAAGQGLLSEQLLPADAALPDWPVVRLGPEDVATFNVGNAIAWPGAGDGNVRVHSHSGDVLGLAKLREGQLQPKRVFQLQ